MRRFVLDISERKQAEETVRYLIYHDLLTGLPNRVLPQERLEQAIGLGRGEKGSVSLLFLALDRFREINNTLGHKNGDRVIKELARRLSDVLGESERVARLRGDEFAVLLPGADATLARQVASKVLQSLEQPSLAYLRRLPVRELKIDKSFVIGMCSDVEEGATIVRSTNDLGHNLGLRVVAEGVEDQRTLERLASFGCDAAQGYHIARPMGAADFAGWMKSSPWRPTAGH